MHRSRPLSLAVAAILVAALSSSAPGQTVPPTPPPSTFALGDAGSPYFCGIRQYGALNCTDWGYQQSIIVPPGLYTQVAAYRHYFCAVRLQGSLICLGRRDNSGETRPPAGNSYVAPRLNDVTGCAQRPDNVIECWGSTYDATRPDAGTRPQGAFATFALGGAHGCTIDSDRAIKCWGAEYGNSRPVVPPQGQAFAVAARMSWTCAIMIPYRVACFGRPLSGDTNTFVRAPTQPQRQLAMSHTAVCGVGIDNLLSCWGDTTNLQVPSERAGFGYVQMGSSEACAQRLADRSLMCFGNNTSFPPPGPFLVPGKAPDRSRHLSGGGDVACAITLDGTLNCWGSAWALDNPSLAMRPPSGTFTSVTAGEVSACGLRANGSVTCWGGGLRIAPTGAFMQIAQGGTHLCAIRVARTEGEVGFRDSRTVACWGGNGQPETTPSGQFVEVEAGYQHACGIRLDASAVCWGFERSGDLAVPVGQYQHLALGAMHSCGLRVDNSVACWGDNSMGQTNAPAGSFSTIVAGEGHTCGTRFDSATICWGQSVGAVPAGTFSELTAGRGFSCGVRADGSVTCWGRNDHAQGTPPANLRVLRP